MNERLMPKRRRDKENPYKLSFKEINEELGVTLVRYYVSFKDGIKGNVCLEIDKDLYDMFNEFELDDLSYLNEYDRHYEHSCLTEPMLHRRMMSYSDSLQSHVEIRVRLKEALDCLTKKQKRRIYLYYFCGYSYDEISKLEGCSIQSIAKSIKGAIKKLKFFLIEG